MNTPDLELDPRCMSGLLRVGVYVCTNVSVYVRVFVRDRRREQSPG